MKRRPNFRAEAITVVFTPQMTKAPGDPRSLAIGRGVAGPTVGLNALARRVSISRRSMGGGIMTGGRAERRGLGLGSLKPVIEMFSLAAGICFIISGGINGFVFHRFLGLNYFEIATPSDVVMSGFGIIPLLVIPLNFVCLVGAAWLYLPRRSRMFYFYACCAAISAGIVAMVFTAAFLQRMHYRNLQAVDKSELSCELPSVRWIGSASVIVDCPNGRFILDRSDVLLMRSAR